MGREKHLKRKAAKKKKKSEALSAFQSRPLWLILPLIATLIAFQGIYDNEYINYDDDVYVTENVPLRTMDVETLFSEEYMNQYSPLAMTLMGQVFRISDGDPTAVRTYSVLIHVLCVLMVFVVFRQLFRDDYAAAALALLFGVHPMQVESVAWLAASMKIGSYTLFFLVSMWAYIRFKQTGKSKFYVLTFIAFLASCLCKEQAVVLPVVLVALDYLQGQSLFEKKTWFNKLPLLLISVIFGVVTLQASGGDELAQKIYEFSFADRVVFASYSIGMYVVKLFVPIDLSFFYTYPVKGEVPAYFYLFPFLVIGLLFGLWKAYLREKRWLVFGILFFLVNVALTTMTAIMSVRDVIMADRYVYLAALGVFFCFIQFTLNRAEKQSWLKYLPLILAVPFLMSSISRVESFQDSVTVFSDVIEKGQYEDRLNPYLALPYNNRGIAYKRAGQRDIALKDYEQAIASNPSYPNAHLNKGNLYFDAGQDEEALAAYDKVLSLQSDNAKALSARGAIYAKKKQYDKAIEDLSKAIKIDRYFLDAYSNRALTYLDMLQLDKAIADVSTIIGFAPDRDDMYEFRGYLYSQQSSYKQAHADFSQAIRLNPQKSNYYYNRAIANRGLGDKAAARQDADKARSLGYTVPQEFYDSIR
ncbi:MAG: tetratricopeptide repeat protein [Flavobacteriales bacterium]|nr:tetratricopeptide repeat protein [Flavobacteriales bacterium]